jgi:class 3 adenylate cyclase
LEEFTPAANALGFFDETGVRTLVSLPIAVGIIGMSLLLLWPRGATPLSRAQLSLFIACGAALACEGMQLGLAPDPAANQMSSFAFSGMVVFALAPLRIRQVFILVVWGMLIPVVTLLMTGDDHIVAKFVATLSLPLSAMVLGVLVQRWELRNFRLQTLSDLRLQRRTLELERQKTEAEQQRTIAEEQQTEAEHQRSRAMSLLASALTAPIARAYQRDGYVKPFTQTVVVIFCDAVQFSDSCKNLQPERIVSEMQRMWTEFDRACLEEGLGVEPLRAEGDARMAVAGLEFDGQEKSIHRAAIAATLAMLRFRKVLPQTESNNPHEHEVLWPMRIGINIGTVTAGVIDTNQPLRKTGNLGNDRQYGRLWFDVWGDTVNMAARLAQSANPNQILVRERMLWEMGGLFDHGAVRSMRAKDDVIPDLAEIIGIASDYRDEDQRPNSKFWKTYNSASYRPTRPSRKGTDSDA